MPGPQPSHSRDPPRFLLRNMATRHNPEPGMLPKVVQAALHTDPLAQGREVPPHGPLRHAAAPSVHEERGRGGTTAGRHCVDVLGEGPREFRPDRQGPRLNHVDVAWRLGCKKVTMTSGVIAARSTSPACR
jgi:hypothetical protein